MRRIEQPTESYVTVEHILPYVKTRHEVEHIEQPLPVRLANALNYLYDEAVPLPVQMTISEPDPEHENSEESVLAMRYPQLIPVLSAGRDITVKAPHIDRMLELPFDAAALIANHLTSGTSSASAAALAGDDDWATSLKRAVERTWYSKVIDTVMHLLAAGDVMNEFQEVINRGPKLDITSILEAGWQAYQAVFNLELILQSWSASTQHMVNIQQIGSSCDLGILMKVAPYLRRHIGTFIPVNMYYFLTALLGGRHSQELIRRSVHFGILKTTDGQRTFNLTGRGLVLCAHVETRMDDIVAVDPIKTISNYVYLLGRLDPFVIAGRRLDTIEQLSDSLMRDFYKGMRLPRYYVSHGEELVHDPLLQISHEMTVLSLLEASYKNASSQENVGVALATRLGLASAQAANIGAAYHAMYHLAMYPVALTLTYHRLMRATLQELDSWLLSKVEPALSTVRDAVLESIHNRPAYGETFEELQASLPDSLRKAWEQIKEVSRSKVIVNRRRLGQTNISLFVGPGEIKVYNAAALSLAKVKNTKLLGKEIAFNTVLEALNEATQNAPRAELMDITIRRLPISGHSEIIRLCSFVDSVVASSSEFTYYVEDIVGFKPHTLFFPDLDALARHFGYENWERLRVLVNPKVFEEMTQLAKTIVGVPVHELQPQLIETRSVQWAPTGWFGERLLVESAEELYSALILKQKVQVVDRLGNTTLEDIPYPFFIARRFLNQNVYHVVAIERPPKPTRYAADVKPDIVTVFSQPEAPDLQDKSDSVEPSLELPNDSNKDIQSDSDEA